ncbi:PREDICTED: high mobility group B protein 13-like [Nicrophorus vespilloides]|uniref:High mobility group B protein 13-like n=1 Tax=Nicrophorus vespilloides TaxID=110193 RepID=A0ABM1N0V3_NICVS|nr:PREDICTED: high mobility group B protein 13-like [Nicrophorus vespilloides]
MMSDDSENDGAYVESNHENNVYYKKYKLLLAECENIQKSNERLVYRIEEVKKISQRRFEQVKYMKDKLMSKYGEDWTEIPEKKIKLEDEEATSLSETTNHFATVKEESAHSVKEEAATTVVEERSQQLPPKPPPPPPQQSVAAAKPVKKKRKSNKSEKDPNAPKRPSNPFFQFCQDQRQVLLGQIMAELKPGEVEPTKQELTRQLAIKWRSLSTADKQIYVDMYERSKEKYAVEMSEYNMKK